MGEAVRYETKGPVASIIIERPETKNALGPEEWRQVRLGVIKATEDALGAAIAVACGVEGIGSAAAWLAHRVIPSWRRGAVLAPVAVTALAAALVAVQVIPALAVSYRTPKDDYRAVVEHVTAVSPPGSFILALGTLCSIFDLVYVGLLSWAKRQPVALNETAPEIRAASA